MDVPNVVRELVKNSIDAQCTVVQIEINDSFDIRVTDDGCGFSETVLQDIGQSNYYQSIDECKKNRSTLGDHAGILVNETANSFLINGQIITSNALRNIEFPYARNGRSLLTIAQITEEIYIESIKHNSNVRFYKTINSHKSENNLYKIDRKWKDATVLTVQGSSVVLNNLIFQNVDNANSLKMDIIKAVTELALINFEIKISVKDTKTQQILYETERTHTLFDKFEHYLESNQLFSKIRFVSCQKHNVMVELYLCEDGISNESFQFVYFNKLITSDVKWTKLIKDLCGKQFEKDLNAMFAVYLANIRVKNHLDNQLANNVIIDNCIKKCFEQLVSPSKVTAKGTTLQKNNSQDAMEIRNEGESKRPTNCNERNIQGVRLGDWIFNNSCENYEMFNDGRKNYRNKICENWVISLEKPKPKDPNDSLKSVELVNIQHDENVFKKPKNRQIGKSRSYLRKDTERETSKHLSTNIYKPSQHIEQFNSSGLMRTSKQLITNVRHNVQNSMSKLSARIPKECNMNLAGPKVTFQPPENDQNRPKGSSFEEAFQLPSPAIPIENTRTSRLLDISSPHIQSLEHTAFESPVMILNDNNNSNDHFQIHRSMKETFDFQFHKRNHKSKFNMTFSSSVAIHAMKDPFMELLEKEDCDVNSISHLYENNRLLENTPRLPPQSEVNRCYESSSVYTTSQVHYRQQCNNSFRHYRQTETSQNRYNRCNSVSSCHRSQVSSRVTKYRPSKSIRSPPNSASTVAPFRSTSSTQIINDGIRQSGWPVTININFGLSK